ncbi:unnamed protein product [Durusdinium trenchii]|uniref:Plastid lipid-associated protein/fibrillin conserved domain-containing protein n=1 Tax=Durusdinium trenchii TaxID=1381693 RepID=A0ABP0NHB4_9DINO
MARLALLPAGRVQDHLETSGPRRLRSLEVLPCALPWAFTGVAPRAPRSRPRVLGVGADAMWASAEVTEVAPWVVAAAALVSLVGAIQGLRRGALKKELLELISTTQRGSDESQNAEVQRLFTDLEGLSPISEPLSSDELRGDWELVWTTSAAILGLGRPGFLKPLEDQPILQFLDPQAGVARNLEFTPLGCNRVDASIVPLGPGQREAFVSRLDDFLLFKQGAEEKPGGSYLPQAEGLEKTTVGVRFKTFTLFGLIPVPAPENATGILQVTYLDDDLRLSRGDRGNLFVLKKVSSELSA